MITTKYNLQNLVGKSEKQINYGDDARARAISEMVCYFEARMAKCPNEHVVEMERKAESLIQAFVDSYTTAKDWIEPKMSIHEEIARLIKQSR